MFIVDDTCLPENLKYFAKLLTFVISLYNLNFIILSDAHELDVVLLSQLFGKRERNNVNVGKGVGMFFMVLALVSSHKGIKSHFWLLPLQ